jgi:hypothetical protein
MTQEDNKDYFKYLEYLYDEYCVDEEYDRLKNEQDHLAAQAFRGLDQE